ncbi:hypothetical protein QP880_07565 [Dermabacter hominis]|uniref:hypothetical protein n=1 Tax=Dermabacter hominis TaxID=36740 RepID=UPI00316AD390|nr:hypothetical protein [Dermabacter hominis]
MTTETDIGGDRAKSLSSAVARYRSFERLAGDSALHAVRRHSPMGGTCRAGADRSVQPPHTNQRRGKFRQASR